MIMISLEAFRESGNSNAAHPDAASPRAVSKVPPVPPRDAQAAHKPKHSHVPPEPTQSSAAPQPKTLAPSVQSLPNAIPTEEKKRGEEGESLGINMLNRIRTNWLKPTGNSQSFRCRLRIDYLAGGYIANVVMLEGCGNNSLNDSVERAVWKTQPLPLDPVQNGAGSLTLEFTP